jgi:hypothetical protein
VEFFAVSRQKLARLAIIVVSCAVTFLYLID